MKYEPINGGFKKLKEDLSKMTFKDKLNHLWSYYKGSLVILAVLFLLFSIVFTTCKARNTDTILSGVSINVLLTDEGQSYVRDEFYEKYKTGGLEQVIYTETHQEDFSNTMAMQDSYIGLMSLLALGSQEELDYLLVNEVALKNLLSHEIFMDLRDFFTEAELEALGDNIVWINSSSEEAPILTPVAVNVEHLSFIAQHAKNGDDTYIGFVTNTPRKEACRNFWEHLSAWTPASE